LGATRNAIRCVALQIKLGVCAMQSIVRATVSDSSYILALQKRAYESEARTYNDWTIPPLTQSLDALAEEIKNTIVLKAIDGERIVGSVRATLTNGVCSVGRLIVEPEYQRQGIGTKLLQAIEAAHPKAIQFQLFTGSKSEDNIRLYQHHGYEVTEAREISTHVTLVFMVKQATDA
jgi:ribosomal protein S18 acetylase RimI-like enzyme